MQHLAALPTLAVVRNAQRRGGVGVVRGIVVLSGFSRPRCLVPSLARLSASIPPFLPPSLPPSRLFVSGLPHSDNSRIRHFRAWHGPRRARTASNNNSQVSLLFACCVTDLSSAHCMCVSVCSIYPWSLACHVDSLPMTSSFSLSPSSPRGSLYSMSTSFSLFSSFVLVLLIAVRSHVRPFVRLLLSRQQIKAVCGGGTKGPMHHHAGG